MIEVGVLITGLIAWLGSKAVPTIHQDYVTFRQHRIEEATRRYESAQYLCKEKDDCEPLKRYAICGNRIRCKIPPQQINQRIEIRTEQSEGLLDNGQ